MAKLIAELTATCNALGYAVNGKKNYFLDTECKEAIRELIRFLKRDDESHEIRRHLGSARILQTDLVPILLQYYEDEEILDLLLRLIVNLTTPPLLLYNEELPTEKLGRHQYLEIEQQLQDYKQAFNKQELWTFLSEKLSNLLTMDWVDRDDEKSLIIVRILILVRNVLHVPFDIDIEKRPDNDANTHDQVIWALYEGGMINLVLYIGTSENEKQYYFHVLEIISLMLRDQNAETLASASIQRSVREKEQDEAELMVVREKEMRDKQERIMKHVVTRHSRFGGTFVVRGVKSISDNDQIVFSLDRNAISNYDRRKSKQKTPKNRLPMQSSNIGRRSALSVRVLMKEFCIEFLNGAYNNVMHYMREMFHRGKAQNNDESYYFWAMKFFMEFNRQYKFEVKLISETMHVPIFHFTQDRIEDWRSKLIVDKKKMALWSKRVHLALKAYKELLQTLFKMYLSQNHAVKESAHTIMSNLFYVIEYRELLLGLLNFYEEQKFSREYLADLIESNHIFLKMLEHFCKRHRTILVQKKSKVRRKRQQKAKKSKKQIVLSLEPNDSKWMELKPRITDIFTNRTELNVESMPFDAASDIPFEDQKVEAMRRIRFHLLNSQIEDAISLFRASREVWPENDCFGAGFMPPEEECTALQEIFFADIGFPASAFNTAREADDDDDDNDGTATEEENDEANQAMNINLDEQTFKLEDFVKKYARPKIAEACCLLLSQFEKNSVFTNHSIVKLLHRITFDCKFAAILFQASVFRIFQRVFNATDHRHKEIKQFAVYIVRKFIEVARQNKKVYMEMLFWKTNKEAYEIEEGYGTLSRGNSRKIVADPNEEFDEGHNEIREDQERDFESRRSSTNGNEMERSVDIHEDQHSNHEEHRRSDSSDEEDKEISKSISPRTYNKIEDSRAVSVNDSDEDDIRPSDVAERRKSESEDEIVKIPVSDEQESGRRRGIRIVDSDSDEEAGVSKLELDQ